MILQRYVVIETSKVFAAALIGTTLIMTLGVGLNEGLKKGMPLGVSLRLLPFVIPESLRLTIPTSFLFSVGTVFGRLAADREVTALKASGINPLRIFVPVLWMANVLSFGTFLMYEVCASWARPGLKHELISGVDEIAYAMLKANHVIKGGDMTILVKGVEGKQLIRPRVEIIGSHGHATVAEASNATLEGVSDQGLLRVSLTGVTFNRSECEGALPGVVEYVVPFWDPPRRDSSASSPAELTHRQLAERIEIETKMVDALRRRQRTEREARVAAEIKSRTSRLFRLQAETPRRLSNGFAVFAFALVGIPVATWSESKDNMAVFLLCIVPIATLYYPLLVIGEELARAGFYPQLSVWIAPSALIVVGIVLLRRLVRH